MDSGATILIADDQPDFLENVSLTLEAAGYRVLTADDGVKALTLLQSESVNLILADIAMPRMNGYQLHKRVRENPEWLTIPFILLTARSLNSDIRYGKELGVDDYLTKPIQPEDLLAAVRGSLRRASQLSRLVAQPPPDKPKEQEVLNVGQLRINVNYHQAWLCDQELDLTPKEFLLLKYLTQQANNVVTLEEIVQATNQIEVQRTEATSLVAPILNTIRGKLKAIVGDDQELIENVRGIGYRLIPLHN